MPRPKKRRRDRGQIHGSALLHHSITARSGIRLRLNRAYTRTGKRGEGGGEADSKVLRAYGRDVLNENGKLLLGFANKKQAHSSEHFILYLQKWRALHVPTRQPQQRQARLNYILIKQAHRRLICCVNVRRPPLEEPVSNHNLVYAKVRIPRRSAPNRRKRDSTKETSNVADLRRLMTDPNLRCQVTNVMVAKSPPIPDGTCISDIATDVADVMLSTTGNFYRALSARAEHRVGARCGG